MSNSEAEAWASCRGSSWAAAATAETARADSSCCYKAKCRCYSRGVKILFFSFFPLPAPASFYSQIRLLEHTKTGRGESDSDGGGLLFSLVLVRRPPRGERAFSPYSLPCCGISRAPVPILSEDLICPPGNSSTSDYTVLPRRVFNSPHSNLPRLSQQNFFSLVCPFLLVEKSTLSSLSSFSSSSSPTAVGTKERLFLQRLK